MTSAIFLTRLTSVAYPISHLIRIPVLLYSSAYTITPQLQVFTFTTTT
jgi:hypothetical protein